MEVIDLCASMLLIPSHVFFILVKLESKNLKQYCLLLKQFKAWARNVK